MTRTLGNPDFEGSAVGIIATRVSCRRARQVAASCLRDRLHGWVIFSSGDGLRVRTRLERGQAVVSFQIAGGGGCFKP